MIRTARKKTEEKKAGAWKVEEKKPEESEVVSRIFRPEKLRQRSRW